MRNNLGRKIFAISLAALLGVGGSFSPPPATAVHPAARPLLQTSSEALASTAHSAENFRDKGSKSPSKAITLELAVAPTEAVLLPDSTQVTVRAQLRNTGDVTSEAGVLSIFVDPTAHVSRETLAAEFPRNAAMIAQKSVPVLQAGQEYSAAATLSLRQLASLFAEVDAAGRPALNSTANTPNSSHPGAENESSNPSGDKALTAAELTKKLNSGTYRLQALYTPRSELPEAPGHSKKQGRDSELQQDRAQSEDFLNESSNPSLSETPETNQQEHDSQPDPQSSKTKNPQFNENYISLEPAKTWLLPNSADPHAAKAETATAAAPSLNTQQTPSNGAENSREADTSASASPDTTLQTSQTLGIVSSVSAKPTSFGAASSFILVRPNSKLPVNKLTSVVPLILPQNIEGLPNPTQLNDLLGPETPLRELLNFAVANNATVAIDPRLIVAVRAAGETAPETALDFLKELAKPSLSSFLLSYADADPVTQQLLGLPAPLEPLDITFALHSSAVTDHPSSTAYEQLHSWPTTAPATVWFNPGTASLATVSVAQSAERLLLSGSDLVTHSGGPRITLAETGQQALVGSAELATAASLISQQPPNSLVAQVATANLFRELLHSPEAVLLTDRFQAGENLRTARLLSAIHSMPFVSAVPAGQLSGGGGQLQAHLAPAAAAAFETQKPQLTSALRGEKTVLESAAVLAEPSQLTDYQRSRLLTLFNAGRLRSDSASLAAFKTAAAEFLQRDTELRSGIQLLAPPQTNIIGHEVKLPLQVRNDLPFKLRFALHLQSGSAALELPEEQFTDLSVNPGDTVTVLAPLRSKTASGSSSIEVRLTSSNGEHTVRTETFSIEIASYLETIGLVSLVLVLVLLFSGGIWRWLRSKQAATVSAAKTTLKIPGFKREYSRHD